MLPNGVKDTEEHGENDLSELEAILFSKVGQEAQAEVLVIFKRKPEQCQGLQYLL